MVLTFSHRALQTRAHLLTDERRVTVRHAVPSDAPRLVGLLDTDGERPSLRDVVAIDDHGAIVGHAAEATAAIAVADGWSASGLDRLLQHELLHGS